MISVKKPNKLKVILRWIAFLPAAIGGGLIGMLVVDIIAALNRWFLGLSADSIWGNIPQYAIGPMVGAALFVYWGTKVAPLFKKAIALILGITVVIFSIAGLVAIHSKQFPDAWWLSVTSLSLTFGAGYVVGGFLKKGDDFNLFKFE